MDTALPRAVLSDPDELARLRRRAYGPDADIAGDAAALERLAELESALRSLTVADDHGSPEVEASPITAASAAAAPHAPASAGEANEELPADAGHPTLWWHHPPMWMLAVGVLVTATAIFLALPAARRPSPHETLHVRTVIPDEVWAEINSFSALAYHGIYARSEVRLFEDFRGVNVWSAPTRHGTMCLLATTPAEGLWRASCAPPGVEPQLELNKYLDDLRHRGDEDPWPGMRTGSLIRLVLSGDTVLVWSYPAPGPDAGEP